MNQEPLSIIADRLLCLIESMLRAGGHPHRPREEPARVKLTREQRQMLVIAKDALLHELRGTKREAELVGMAMRVVQSIAATRCPKFAMPKGTA